MDLTSGSLTPTGDQLAAVLTQGGESVFAGFEGDYRIEARLGSGEFRLALNFGGSVKPTRREAEALLAALERRYDFLTKSSASFAALVSGISLVVELYVYSGPMDFSVAERSGGKTRWFAELED